MTTISSSAEFEREQARRKDGRFGPQHRADPGQLADLSTDTTIPRHEDATLARKEAFEAAITPTDVAHMVGYRSARWCTDHYSVASLIAWQGTTSLTPDVESRLADHWDKYGTYGEFARYRTTESWEDDPLLHWAQRNATPADMAWDQLVHTVDEPTRALQDETQRTRGTWRTPTPTDPFELGDIAHHALLDPTRQFTGHERTILKEFATKYGPYGRFRELRTT